MTSARHAAACLSPAPVGVAESTVEPPSRFQCAGCGYRASCRRAPERCPMCGGDHWTRAPQRGQASQLADLVQTHPRRDAILNPRLSTKAVCAREIDAVRAPLSGDDAVAAAKPTLVFVHSPTSGASRRVEGFIAHVLQRRRNHGTFMLRRVNYEERPDLAARLGVKGVPAIVVIEAKRVRARLERPRGCAELTTVLAPWLR